MSKLWLSLAFAGALAAAEFPAPRIDPPESGKKKTAVLAGGCFWGVEAVFERLKGVSDVVSGYAGGDKSTANYKAVGSGRTGHAESVRITYDPSQITYGRLLQVYFSVAHDPTQLNRQGPDVGPQYRSAIFYSSEEQKQAAEGYIRQLEEAKLFARLIVTEVKPLSGFYSAEEFHQDYVARNPTNEYVMYHDIPKIGELKRRHPEWVKRR